MKIIDIYNLYKEKGILIRSNNDGLSQETTMITYYLKYHILDSIRCIHALSSIECYNEVLYGDIKEKINRINYYHHYVVSLIMNLGVIYQGSESIKEHLGAKLIHLSMGILARNSIAHIFQKTKEYNDLGITLSGFNLIENEGDGFLHSIKKPLGLYDIPNQTIRIYGSRNKNINLNKDDVIDDSIKLPELRKQLEKALDEVNLFSKFLKDYSGIWH